MPSQISGKYRGVESLQEDIFSFYTAVESKKWVAEQIMVFMEIPATKLGIFPDVTLGSYFLVYFTDTSANLSESQILKDPWEKLGKDCHFSLQTSRRFFIIWKRQERDIEF